MNITTTLRYAFAAATLMAASSAFAAPKECDLVITKVSPASLQAGDTFFEFQCTLDGKNGMIVYNTILDVKTASGTTVTSGRFQYTTDWNDPAMDDYNQGYFFDGLAEGTYYLDIPANCIYDDINNPEAASVTNKALSLKLVVGEGGGGNDDDTFFEPNNVDPTPGREIDSSMSDWTIAFYFEQKVTVNTENAPYLLFNDERIDAESFFSLGYLNAPKQANANFAEMNKRENGNYTLVLPSGAVSYEDGSVNKEMRYEYTWNGGKKSGDDPIEDLKLVSASISMGGVNYDLMNAATKIAFITPENAYLNVTVEPTSIEAIDVRILDVTEVEESQYSLAEAIWSNTIDVTSGGGFFSKEIYSIDGYKLYSDRKYVLEVKAYSVYQLPVMEVLGTAYTATFAGDSEAIKFSPVDIISIEPAPGSEFKIGDKMVITFSAPVTLVAGEGKSGFSNGNAGWANFTSMSPNADKTVWTISFPNSQINAAAGPNQIETRIWGKDDNGLLLCPASYNVDEITNDAYNLTVGEDNSLVVLYSGYAKCPTVIVTPSETETVNSLNKIGFSITGQKEMNYSWMVENPKIYNDNNEEVAEVLAADFVITTNSGTETDPKPTAIEMPLSKAITETGTYTLDLPWNLFVVGREQSSYPSAPGKYIINVVSSTVGVEGVATDAVTVIRNANGFAVNGVSAGDVIAVFNLAGTKVASETATGNSVNIECQPGIYVITVNGANAVKAIR